MGCPDWNIAMQVSGCKDFCGSTVLSTLESVGMNGQIDWQAQQTSHLVCCLAGQIDWQAQLTSHLVCSLAGQRCLEA